jgi:hypothetical protein
MKHFYKSTIMLGVLFTLLLIGGFSVSAAETDDGGAQTSAIEKNEYVEDGYNAAKSYYFANKTFTSYWAVFGAYATLGDAIQNSANKYTYTAVDSDPNQLGADALAVIMMGGDPYNYNGKNLVQKVVDKGASGGFSVPVFNFLALQAAGYDFDSNSALEEDLVEYCCDQLTELTLGPDIGGWALVALSRYLDGADYQSQINAAITTFENEVSEQMSGESMGSDGLSTGCVVTGFTALTAAGVDGYDVTTDATWVAHDPLRLMWSCYEEDEVSDFYDHQYYMEFSDLNNVLYEEGRPGWIACGVSRDRLNDLIIDANALLAQASQYTSGSIDRLEAAMDAVDDLTETELSETIPTWGEAYYALYHAVQNCKAKGNAALMTDLDHGQWYDEMVSGVVSEGLMNGTSDTTFAPNAKLTRAMMVQILYNMSGQPAYTIDNPFSDVSDTAWYAAAIIWANENEIANGIDSNTFKPNQSVTREQMAAFICRYANVMGITLQAGSAPPFNDDADIASYAKTNVYTLVNEGIISGMGGNTFAPRETATRAQVAKIIYYLMPKMEA